MSNAPTKATVLSSELSVPRNRYAIFFGLAVLGCLLDLWTKAFMFDRLGLPGESDIWWVWEGFFGFETSVNQGALFGAAQGFSALFAIISVVFGVVILAWLFWQGGARDLLLTVALGCVMAGILGNLYDRLGLWHGADAADVHRNGVRDWILFRFGSYNWPNFNIADTFLVSGAGLLMIQAFRPEPAVKAEQAAQA